MNNDEFLDLIFKAIKMSLVKLEQSVKITAVHCSGVNVSICDENNNLQTYNITVAKNK